LLVRVVGSLACCRREVLALAGLSLKLHRKGFKLPSVFLFLRLGLKNVIVQRGQLSCGLNQAVDFLSAERKLENGLLGLFAVFACAGFVNASTDEQAEQECRADQRDCQHGFLFCPQVGQVRVVRRQADQFDSFSCGDACWCAVMLPQSSPT
jgi:hypothetical protein